PSTSARGTTSVCPSAAGRMSRKANVRSSSYTRWLGMSPAMMREKIEGMAPSSPVVVALDVGSSGIKALVYDASGRVLAERRGTTPIDRDGTANASAVADAVDRVVDDIGGALAGIGAVDAG